MARGIERTKIFRSHKDREHLLCRLEERAHAGAWQVYAWTLMPNHMYLLVRTGLQPLSTNMRKVMTGYVVNFNRRHNRSDFFLKSIQIYYNMAS
jgi:REP element-mobilizing transposase RayT